jgi:four helix bundle protein
MSQITNPKQIKYDLEDRTLAFSRKTRDFVNKLPKNIPNIEYGKQLIRSAGSIGANYIEANDALSKKDFIMRIKISRKESKETCYWLKLVEPSTIHTKEQEILQGEATELMKIFGSILLKSST